MNAVTLSNELVKIILTGDMHYAGAYYSRWCDGVQWSPFQAAEVRRACEKWGVDPGRFGAEAKQSEEPTERITYEWTDSE
jgi:cyclopropane fatty-acyl-phospholipid synthase-like methyltransferase